MEHSAVDETKECQYICKAEKLAAMCIHSPLLYNTTQSRARPPILIWNPKTLWSLKGTAPHWSSTVMLQETLHPLLPGTVKGLASVVSW